MKGQSVPPFLEIFEIDQQRGKKAKFIFAHVYRSCGLVATLPFFVFYERRPFYIKLDAQCLHNLVCWFKRSYEVNDDQKLKKNHFLFKLKILPKLRVRSCALSYFS